MNNLSLKIYSMDSQVLGAVEVVDLAFKPETVWCNEKKFTSKSEIKYRTYVLRVETPKN